MSENLETAVAPALAEQQQPEQINGMDLATLAAINFGEPLPQPATEPTTTTPEATTESTPAAAPSITDYTPFVKEFGYEKYEDFKSEFESLKALKNQPPTKEEVAFANEESKRIHENIKAGKTDEVYAYLHAQRMLSGVDTMGADDKLKLQIKLQNPKFDNETIDYLFDKQFGFDESKYDEGSKEARFEKMIADQKKESAAEAANEFFSQYKQKIELPEIGKSSVSADPDYEDFKASTAEMLDVVEKVVKPGLLSVKENDVAMNFKLQDDNNQMNFDLGISVTPEDLEQARNSALNWNDFVNKATTDDKGNFSPTKAIQLVLKVQNLDKYAVAIARQAVNAERKRLVSETTTDGTRKDFTVPPRTRLDEIAEYNFAV